MLMLPLLMLLLMPMLVLVVTVLAIVAVVEVGMVLRSSSAGVVRKPTSHGLVTCVTAGTQLTRHISSYT